MWGCKGRGYVRDGIHSWWVRTVGAATGGWGVSCLHGPLESEVRECRGWGGCMFAHSSDR